MSTKIIYFIVDATHADFDQAKSDAEQAQSDNVGASSILSWRYNNSSPVTKAMVKVIGEDDTWWDGSPQYALKDSALFLNVYYSTDHASFVTEMAKAEWSMGSPGTGSPE